MSSSYDYIIVGDGIAARCVLFYLSLDEKLSKKSILQVASEAMQPSCSLRTTSVVSSGLHQRGISDLGDIICDSLESFLNYYHQFSPAGVYFAKQYSMGERGLKEASFNGVSCLESDCYQIHAEVFLSDLKRRALTKLSNYQFINDTCLEINEEQKSIQTHVNKSISYGNKLILCTGAYTSLLLNNPNLNDGKPVSGSYYQWDNIDFEDSFVISKGHFNIIYRKEDRSILFGGTSIEGLVFIDNIRDLNSAYEELTLLVPDLNFPDISKAQVRTGIRHKGKKRLPQLKILGDILVLNSLYKNGYTFAFHLAQELVSKL